MTIPVDRSAPQSHTLHYSTRTTRVWTYGLNSRASKRYCEVVEVLRFTTGLSAIR